MGFLARCTASACRKRRALPRPPEQYKREPKCLACGGRMSWDRWQEGKNIELRCTCEGYWFTHREGSKWCLHAKQTVTLADMAEKYGGEAVDYVFETDPRIILGEPGGDTPPF